MPGMKRKHAADGDEKAPSKRPSRDTRPGQTAEKFQKRKTVGGGPHGKKDKGKDGEPAGKKYAVNATKTRIRDLKRQLAKAEDMPANIRNTKERELAACEHELAIAQGEQIKQKLIPKYHMVRFFERQKASRILRKAERKLKESTDKEEQSELKQAKHVAEVDLNYTLFYPLIRPYVSLYSTKKDEQGTSKGITRLGGDKIMWELVERRMKDGALDGLRNGLEYREGVALPQDGAEEGPKAQAEKATKKGQQKKHVQTAQAAKESDQERGDSDDGFFE